MQDINNVKLFLNNEIFEIHLNRHLNRHIEVSVYKNRNISGDIFIPREIEYKSQKYVITSIFKGAFKNSEKFNLFNFQRIQN